MEKFSSIFQSLWEPWLYQPENEKLFNFFINLSMTCTMEMKQIH